ncbi:MAG TPA: hypothetical protein V6D17_04910 [Candidatus Obscuribacterales bacterium]
MDHYPLPDFRRQVSMKDMLLCELLCQSGIIDDAEAADLIAGVTAETSFAAILRAFGILTDSKLFTARRLVARYLNDSDNIDKYIREIAKLGGRRKKQMMEADSWTLSTA